MMRSRISSRSGGWPVVMVVTMIRAGARAARSSKSGGDPITRRRRCRWAAPKGSILALRIARESSVSGLARRWASKGRAPPLRWRCDRHRLGDRVLAGLLDGGADLGADAVFGTSAGAFVGTALAAGADIEQLYAAQQAPAVDESTTRASRTLTAAWVWAFLRGRGNPERVGAGFGAVARRFTPQVSVAERHRAVQARLYTTQWPSTLHVAATDADSGVLTAFDHTCGDPLADVVSASGAVPGISPM